ncbi:foot protein 1 variant 2-like [Schistocerca nitens]|uniref:foot protein 1 variant 2-like n=1 Tax=Schistocerca nitens TaxID=7011 RepID=UPI0021179C28|nr:foot protein 1 variant 2-like [Schistocerca nitens]
MAERPLASGPRAVPVPRSVELEPPDAASHAAWASAAVTRHFWDWMTAHPRDPGLLGHALPPCRSPWSLEPPDAASHAAWALAAFTRHFWDWMAAHPSDPGLLGHAPPPCRAPWSLEPPDAASHAAWASAAVTRHFWDWMTAHPPANDVKWQRDPGLLGHAPPPCRALWSLEPPDAASHAAWSSAAVTRHFWMTAHPRDPGLQVHAPPPCHASWSLEPPDAASHAAWASAAVTRHFWDWMTAHPRDPGLQGHAPPPCGAPWSLEPPDAASHAAWASAAVTRHFWDWMTAHPILFTCLTFPNQQTTLNGSATLGFWATRRPRAALRGAWSRLTPRDTPPNDVKWQRDHGLLGHAPPPCHASWSLEPPDAASHAASHATWASAAVTRHFWDWMTAHPILFACLTFPNQQTTLNGSATLGFWATRRPRAALRGAWSRLTPRHTPRGPRPPSLGTSGTG